MKKRPNPWNPARPTGYDRKDKKTKPFYNQNRWKEASRRWRQTYPKCTVQSCRDMVSMVAGQRYTGVTDHIIPIEQEGSGFDKRNYMSLCNFHHNKKSGLEKRYVVLYESQHNEKPDCR